MAKKLPRAARRAQLLETARTIVREEGTDALTLGALAERAGVSKPITYSHFESRSGLMIALYKEIMDQQVAALVTALERTSARLEDVAQVLADAYMECTTAVGPEWHAIAAALKGDGQMDAYQQEMLRDHIAFYADVLTPLSRLSPEAVHRRCVGLIGAAEALSDEMVRGGCTKEQAANDLAALIISWF
ncbi:TetR/AcrR family transcriptional regulator [Halomonas sp. MCCC 1A11062]|uniref:TetR/AcrR family transcriptional regulator n=1 Tax=Halomonas sp. MCCC 1A11062 TaxID=2733485 RepID=UPI001F354533|nr:TetR/AcrR family transcriptional regulator [Halomonas sp. MCCC 1A11062]MCE8037405.1 TetR/AcrR family transcriptional regulator [Halomonas sp. MCCC 1A11062]